MKVKLVILFEPVGGEPKYGAVTGGWKEETHEVDTAAALASADLCEETVEWAAFKIAKNETIKEWREDNRNADRPLLEIRNIYFIKVIK